MQNVEFKFAKDWCHAGVDYKAGDVAKNITPAKALKLELLGAGISPLSRPGGSTSAKQTFDASAPLAKT